MAIVMLDIVMKDTTTIETVTWKMGEYSKKNINVRAAFIHVLGDFIQSMGVFIAALVIYFKVSSNFHQ